MYISGLTQDLVGSSVVPGSVRASGSHRLPRSRESGGARLAFLSLPAFWDCPVGVALSQVSTGGSRP